MQVKNDVWKWIAITAVAFVLGAGGSTLVGMSGIAQVQEEVDEIQTDEVDRRDYEARIHMGLNDDIEDLEKINAQILQRLTRIETLLEAEIARHHP